MSKSFSIALREYRSAVRSKAFVITLVALPVLMIGSSVAQFLLRDKVDTTDKTFVVVDRTGLFEDSFKTAVAFYNQTEIFEGEGDARRKVKPGFIIEFIDPESVVEPPESTLKLSNRVRDKAISGFIEIDAAVDQCSGRLESSGGHYFTVGGNDVDLHGGNDRSNAPDASSDGRKASPYFGSVVGFHSTFSTYVR